MMTELRAVLRSAAIALLVLGCSFGPTPAPSGVAQQRTCGRLAAPTCDAVVGAVLTANPDAKASPLAVADYALRPAALPGSASSVGDYLVAFAPWGPSPSSGPYRSPPMWRVTERNGTWSTVPTYVTDANVCFISLLLDAGLTDYAPTFPSGICE